MRVLVTGGAGFIGSHLVDALLARGDDVVVLDDLSSATARRLAPCVDLVEVDVSHPSASGRIAAARPDAIVHLAAQVSVPRSMADPARDRMVNVVGTSNVLEGAAVAGAGRIVMVSSGGAIYGEVELADEDAPERPASFYGVHKQTAEWYVRLSGRSYGIARLSNVYGPGQRHDLEGGVVSIFCERVMAGQPITIFGSGEQYRDFVHVSDVVTALIAMLDDRRNGTWNVGTGQAISINDLLARLVALTDREVTVDHLPARSGDIFASCLATGRISADFGWQARMTLEAGLVSLMPAAGSSLRA
jgi:UDP-glucose 4-epimerase